MSKKISITMPDDMYTEVKLNADLKSLPISYYIKSVVMAEIKKRRSVVAREVETISRLRQLNAVIPYVGTSDMTDLKETSHPFFEDLDRIDEVVESEESRETLLPEID